MPHSAVDLWKIYKWELRTGECLSSGVSPSLTPASADKLYSAYWHALSPQFIRPQPSIHRPFIFFLRAKIFQCNSNTVEIFHELDIKKNIFSSFRDGYLLLHGFVCLNSCITLSLPEWLDYWSPRLTSLQKHMHSSDVRSNYDLLFINYYLNKHISYNLNITFI